VGVLGSRFLGPPPVSFIALEEAVGILNLMSGILAML
jgi:hypothetical protein